MQLKHENKQNTYLLVEIFRLLRYVKYIYVSKSEEIDNKNSAVQKFY